MVVFLGSLRGGLYYSDSGSTAVLRWCRRVCGVLGAGGACPWSLGDSKIIMRRSGSLLVHLFVVILVFWYMFIYQNRRQNRPVAERRIEYGKIVTGLAGV